MLRQTRFIAPAFVRIDARLEDDRITLEVWEADDARYISRANHATTYEHCTPSDAFEIISATLDGWGLPDPF